MKQARLCAGQDRPRGQHVVKVIGLRIHTLGPQFSLSGLAGFECFTGRAIGAYHVVISEQEMHIRDFIAGRVL